MTGTSGLAAFRFPTPARILRELDNFDPADTALVTDWIRSIVGLECSIDRYLQLYEEVIDEGSTALVPSAVQPIELALEYAATLEQRLRTLQVPILTVALPPTIAAEIRLRVAAEQARVAVGSTFGVDVSVTNHSAETLASVLPFPVHLSYHWICPGDSSGDCRRRASNAADPAIASWLQIDRACGG